MKCPICSERLLPGTDRCSACGYRMPHSPVPAAFSRPNRPGRRRGCCLPVLILPLILGLLSAIFSFVRDTGVEHFGAIIYEEAPAEAPSPQEPTLELPFFEAPPAASRPAAANERFFSIEDGIVYFDAENWDGSPILAIPETVDDETVTAIGSGCFRDCAELTTIALPDTITQICDEAFFGCTKLRGLYLPSGTESIGEDAFAGCEALEAICIPASVTDIADGCFDDCASLRYIIYDGSFEQWQTLYNQYITPFTTAVCLDGGFYHGTGR